MLVSILIPCFNAERWIAQAIQSALGQTWAEKEVIVVDDGSRDGSLNIIKGFGERIRWETGPNRGANVARNRLLELARGEWLHYLDADDYLLPLKIEKQMRFLKEHPECDILCSPMRVVHCSDHGVIEGEVLAIPEFHDPWTLLAQWRLSPAGGSLWKREALIRVNGWKPDQPCCQEFELYLRLLQSGARFCYFEECHAVYRHFSNQVTVRTKDPAEWRKRRLEINDRMEQFLRTKGELTPGRLQAMNQARFAIARMIWLQDPASANQIVQEIQQCQPGFVPEPPSARGSYQWIYRAFGFEVAERIAACKRFFAGRAEGAIPRPGN
ncbi:MAG TPA: glycosyltransferase [Terriglobales bacterium]|nr:glycosyltransferase [Terriglobales bacterium]